MFVELMFAEQLFGVKDFSKKVQRNVTPPWEDINMQKPLLFHPILGNERPGFDQITTTKVIPNAPTPFRNADKQTTSTKFRMRRALVGFALILLGAFLWTIFALVTGLNDHQVGADLSPDAPRQIYVVQSGDTLWSIAMEFDSDGDPRDTVDRLAALNGGSSLYVGQKLILNN